MIYFVLFLLVVALFIVVYSFFIHRMEERRNYELNESLRRNRKKVKRERVSIETPKYTEIPKADVMTWRGTVTNITDISKPQIGDIVNCNGNTMIYTDKWEVLEGDELDF